MSVREPLITTSPGRLSGTPVFAGTRVPVHTLIDYLEAGVPRTRRRGPRTGEVRAPLKGRSCVAARRPSHADPPRCLRSEGPSQ